MPNQSKIEIIRHSTSHLLAAAVQKLFSGAKFGIGPTIEDGFYYDFDLPHSLKPEDLPKIEKEIRELIKKNLPFKQKELAVKEALDLFKKLKQPYKVELIRNLEKNEKAKSSKVSQRRPASGMGGLASGEKVTIYQTGDFIDLCRGPHVQSTKELKPDAFKLTKIAGAYWRGDEKNKMLQRIYGVAFNSKKELEQYLAKQAEAEKRDHRKIGKELDLFTFSDLVGPGLPLFTPKGVIIIDELKKHIEQICAKYGFEKVLTPHLAKIKLYELSGHAKKFSQELFHVTSERKHKMVIRPVLCPHQTQIYASRPRSYRDLPIRYMETEKMYRAEKPGEVGGLNRVYSITVEDGHIFCRIDQIKEEIKNLVKIVQDFYKPLGIWGKHRVSLSVRDYQHPEKYIGDKKDWDICEKILKKISEETNLKAQKKEGEAALYGPKLDFMFQDALGNEIQIPTIQLDFATPKRFGLVYIDQRGKEVPPVMIHRAILGSYERFMALLIEHFAGAFPIWLAPIQTQIIPVSQKFNKYAQQVKEQLQAESVRVELNEDNETLGKKIRRGELQKIPYLLIVGQKEQKADSVAVRDREKGDLGQVKTKKFMAQIKEEIEKKI